MHRGLFVWFLLLTAIGAAAQKGSTYIDWRDLEAIDFEQRYVEEMQANMLFPKFTSMLKALNGSMVEVKGYIVPVDKEGKSIALSANPYASCFFCGKAGPASVMTVQLKKPNTKYRTDQFRKFSGILRLNATDIRQFYYVLENAIEIGR